MHCRTLGISLHCISLTRLYKLYLYYVYGIVCNRRAQMAKAVYLWADLYQCICICICICVFVYLCICAFVHLCICVSLFVYLDLYLLPSLFGQHHSALKHLQQNSSFTVSAAINNALSVVMQRALIGHFIKMCSDSCKMTQNMTGFNVQIFYFLPLEVPLYLLLVVLGIKYLLTLSTGWCTQYWE